MGLFNQSKDLVNSLIKNDEIAAYNLCLLKCLKVLDIENERDLRYKRGKPDILSSNKQREKIVDICNEANELIGLLQLVILVMIEQYIYYGARIDPSPKEWMQKVLHREKYDFFPDSHAMLLNMLNNFLKKHNTDNNFQFKNINEKKIDEVIYQLSNFPDIIREIYLGNRFESDFRG